MKSTALSAIWADEVGAGTVSPSDAHMAYRGAVEPRRSVLSPGLERWLEAAGERERRTVTLRVRSSATAEDTAADLARAGVLLEGPATGTVVCTVTPASLRALAQEPWVRAVDEPRRLFPRTAPDA